ncbi:MAG: hypothetical protein M3N98_14025, partial [Actinomycetota bacterium]|nr:hypothetical protein [Actinomycetota bacterium]
MSAAVAQVARRPRFTPSLFTGRSAVGLAVIVLVAAACGGGGSKKAATTLPLSSASTGSTSLPSTSASTSAPT